MMRECSVKCRMAWSCGAGVFSGEHILFSGSEQQEVQQQLRLVISDAHQHDTWECRARESPPTADSHALRAAEACVRARMYLKSSKEHLGVGGWGTAPCPPSGRGGELPGMIPSSSNRSGKRRKNVISCHFVNLWTQTFSFSSLFACLICPLSEQTRWTSTEEEKCPAGGDSGGLWRGFRLQRSKCVCVWQNHTQSFLLALITFQ